MDPADVTSLTGAFDVTGLLSTFVAMAPFILGVAGLIIGVALIKWGVKKASKSMKGGVA